MVSKRFPWNVYFIRLEDIPIKDFQNSFGLNNSILPPHSYF